MYGYISGSTEVTGRDQAPVAPGSYATEWMIGYLRMHRNINNKEFTINLL